MTTLTWSGGSGSWSDPTQWNENVVPVDGDAELIGGGTASIAGGSGYDLATVDLGGDGSDGTATLSLTSATLGAGFDIAASNAALQVAGGVGDFGSIDATAGDGTLTIATSGLGGNPGELTLLNDAQMRVSGGETVELDGTLDNHATVTIGAGGDFVDNGSVSQGDAAFEVESGATLSGAGSFNIGLYSSLYLQDGAAPSAQAVTFTSVGGRLLLGTPPDPTGAVGDLNYSGLVSNFQQGDLIDLTNTVADAATFDAATDTLTVTDQGTIVASLNVQGPVSGALTTVSDGGSGTDIEVAGTLARLKYTSSGEDRAMYAGGVLTTEHAASGTPITGAGVTVGIISNSFDAAPGVGASDPANAAALAGYLPLNAATQTCAVDVLSDQVDSGDDNEGMAMAEEVYQDAPGARIDFATDGDTQDSFAQAVKQLQAAGCKVIVDDISFSDEPFFQVAGPIDTAITNALASGVNYFTSAGNDGDAAYQAAYAPASVTLDGQTQMANVFSNGSDEQTITLLAGVSATIALQWAAPYGSSTSQLSLELFDANGNLVSSSQPDSSGSPEAMLTVAAPNSDTQYKLAIVGSLAAGTEFKYILYGSAGGGSTAGGTIDDPAADNSGTIVGHAAMPGVNAVGAIEFSDTPAFGAAASYAEDFSDIGPSDLYFNSSGAALSTPTVETGPEFLAPDGAASDVSGFTPFDGTSAAAPNAAAVAALMLQADPNLTTAQVTSLLRYSAESLGLPSDQQGAGLIQADKAVALALAAEAACFASGTRIATARGEVAVERLRRGDLARTATGRLAPIVWLGHRNVDCARHPRPQSVWPIRIQAHAFAANAPARDLFVSPDHALAVDGVLIPARYLVNGASIAQPPRRHVRYWHVELAEHDVLLAEKLPAESYLDTGNRAAFVGGVGPVEADVAAARRIWAARGCAPLLLAGPKLAAIHARLRRRARQLGHALTGDPDIRLHVAGRPLTPEAEDDGATLRFRLPPRVRAVTLRSRSFVPMQLGHLGGDPRRLGVAVGVLRLDGAAVPLADARLGAGWNDPEPGWRWTAGAASIAVDGGRELTLELALRGRYWRATTPA